MTDREEQFKRFKEQKNGAGKKAEDRQRFKEKFYEEAEKRGLEITEDFSLAVDNLVLGNNLFITAPAGYGKSAFIDLVRSTYVGNMGVCGSTGIASANIRGVTLHSMFKLPLKGISKPTEFNEVAHSLTYGGKDKVLKNLDLLVIDEISMVKSYHLETVDKVLKNLRDDPFTPFGGCQVILVGDVGQLPPVVKSTGYENDFLKENFNGNPFFFSCSAYRTGNFQYIEFAKKL